VLSGRNTWCGQGGDPDCLIGPLGESLGPQQRPRAHFGAVQEGIAELEDAGAQAVLAGIRILGHQIMSDQRAKQSVDGRLGQPDQPGDLSYAQARRSGSEYTQNRGRPLHRLDHGVLSVTSNKFRIDHER
jgi:hypothetical protein